MGEATGELWAQCSFLVLCAHPWISTFDTERSMVKSAPVPWVCPRSPRHPHWSACFSVFWFSCHGVPVEGRALWASAGVSQPLCCQQRPVIPFRACSVHCLTVHPLDRSSPVDWACLISGLRAIAVHTPVSVFWWIECSFWLIANPKWELLQ